MDQTNRGPAERGPQLTCIEIADHPDNWRAAGFDVNDDDVCLLGDVAIRLDQDADDTGGGFVSWSFGEGIGPLTSIDGLQIAPKPDLEDESNGASPNAVYAVDHVVIRSGDPQRTLAALEEAGFPCRGSREGEGGVGVPMSQSFFWAGNVILEVVGPPEGESTTARASEIYGLALVSSDLDRTVEVMGELMSTPKPAVQPGRLISSMHHREVGISVPIAVMSPHPGSP